MENNQEIILAEQVLHEAVVSNNTDLINIDLLNEYNFTYFRYSILHVAVVVSNGKSNIVTQILELDPDLSDALDSRNWSPLHLASVKGDTNISKVLLSRNPHVARVRTSNGDTILHLCLKHRQVESMKLLMNEIQDTEFANLMDAEGNTILHLAVKLNISEALEYLFENNIIKVKVNAMNSIGNTALDMALECTDQTRNDMIILLKQNGARQSKDIKQEKWLSEKRNVLIVLASLTATMTFQAGVNPPGGTWQDNLDYNSLNDNSVPHRAGEAVMAYYYPNMYTHFLSFNTVALMGSLITILLLLMGLPSGKGIVMKLPVTIMWLTIFVLIFTYSASITMTTPKGERASLFQHIILGGIILGIIMTIFRLRHYIRHCLVKLKEFICTELEHLGIIHPRPPTEIRPV